MSRLRWRCGDVVSLACTSNRFVFQFVRWELAVVRCPVRHNCLRKAFSSQPLFAGREAARTVVLTDVLACPHACVDGPSVAAGIQTSENQSFVAVQLHLVDLELLALRGGDWLGRPRI